MEGPGLPAAPVFRPSAEEWQDPLSYLAYVRQHADTVGIAKIVPPEGWQPPFVIDKKRLKFRTRLQSVHQLQTRDSGAAVKQFWDSFNAFMDGTGSRLKKKPMFAGQEIDLYRLYRLVQKRGGYDAVNEDKSWKDIVACLQITDKGGNAAYTLKQHYFKLLQPYEDHCLKRNDGGAGLLAAALDANRSESKSDHEDLEDDAIDDDEAAEILEAMLGLAPAAMQAQGPAKKRRRGPSKEYGAPSHGGIKVPDNIFTMVCEKCKGGHYEDKIILCDRCDKGWHMFCLSPPIETVPDGEWVCPSCISSEVERSAFREGDSYSLDDLERIGTAFERQWFGSTAAAADAPPSRKESEFWRIVNGGEDVVEVVRGVTPDSRVQHSGFPRPGSNDPMATHPWNLNNLPHAGGEHGNLLRFIGGNVPGITAPLVTTGMLFSSFPWRVDQHLLYTVHYTHWGGPKQWYAVPGYASGLFEGAYAAALPEDVTTQPDLMFRPATMVAPSTLTAAGVPVSALTQEAGTFVITFPNAYHAAVDLGNNCSEEVSVAPADWLRFGALSTSRYRNFRRPCAFSQEEMITRAAELATAPKPAVQAVNAAPAADAVANGVGEAMDAEGAGAETPGATPDRPSARTCSYVSKELARVLEEERVMRCKLWTDGLVRSRQVMPGEGMDPEAGGTAECTICHLPLHLSAVECDCCPRRRTCLHHAANLCECPMRRRRLAWRYTLQQLERLQVETQAAVPPAVAAAIESEEVQLQAAVQGALEAAKAVQAAKPVVVAEVKEEEPATANGAETSAATEAPAVKAEEAAGALEELAGLITGLADDGPGPSAAPSGASTGTQLGKRKRDSEMAVSKPTGPLPLTALSPNGYVQGPVRPFAVLDVYPEDQEAVADWLQAISKACAAWCSKATSVLECGGPMADDLPNLVEQAEQFLWGGAGSEAANEVRQLQPRLAAAEDYMAAVHAALKGKPTIEAVQALLQQEPKPLGDPPGLEALREAIVLAQEWRQRCAVLAAPDAPLVDARLLEAAVNEASRLPISLPEAKVLRERLATARKVAEAIRTALPTAREAGRRRKDEGAITVEYLQHLRNQAISARVEMPEVANLTSSLDRLEAWQQNAAEASRVRCQLSELKELLEEAESLPAVLPEIEHIRSLAEKGDVWLRQMQHALATKAPLKKLRELLHAGLRLPVGVPEVEELRQDIRRREWLEAAKKVQSSKGTLHTLTELLNSAPDMGAEDTALAQQIQSKVAAARTWDERAVAFLARYEVAGGLPEDSRPAVEELSELVTEGQATGVKMERLTYLSNQMNAASKWLAKAATCFSAKPAVAEDAAAQQSPDVNGAEPMELENGAPNGHGAAESSDHKPAEGHVPQASKPEGPAPKYDLIVALVQEYERNLMVFCKEVEGLRELQKAADAWLETARPVLEQEFVVDEQLPQLRELIASGKATGVHMEQVDILEANVEALLWAQQVRELLQKLPEKLTTDPLPETNPAGDDQAAAPTSAPEPPAANGGPDAPSQLVDEAARQPEGEGHEDELARAAAAAHPGLCFGIPPPDPDPSDTEDDAPPITTPYDQRPALPALVALLEEGSILPCDEELFLRFKGCVETAQEWERQARAALAVNKEGGPASLVDVRAMRRLVAQGERLGMAVPALPRLHDVLRAHGKWEQRVRDLMATAGARPAFAELQVFQQTARLSPVNSNLRRHIDAAVDAVEDWKERCRRLVAKRNTGMRLERCFEVLGYSVDCAVEQFERRLEVEKQLVATGPQRKVPGGEGEDERELYCLCQQPYNVDTAMISCDLCGEWYHMRCVGMSQAQARSLRKYTCPICAAVRNSMEPLEYTLGKLRRTQRPKRDELGQLLAEIKALPATVEDEAMLERLLVKCDRWATATNRAVEVHEASRKKDSGAQVLPLSDGMLHQLCKSALAMEIDAQEHAERILHLLRCNRWRARVDAVLGAGSAGNAAPGAPPGKASAEAVAKLLIEADRLEVDTKTDVAGVRLLEAADKTRVWQESVKQCIADLKAAGSAHDPAFAEASARAKELAKDAESLPIRVDRELEKLAEYSKPYCLCRRTYDEQIPMLECDSCSEWYHFGCVGLKAPGSGNDDGDSVPERFSCPVCCLKSQTKYAFFHRLPQTSVDALKEMADAMPPPQRAAPAPTTAQGAGPNAGATNMSNPAAAAAAAAAAAHMMYPQGWQFAMGRGGIPVPMMPGMMNPQALQQMMEAFPGAMPPMMHPGMMFGFPGMHQAMAAAAAAQQQQLQQQQQQQQQEARAAAEGAQQAAAPVKGDGGSSAPAAAGDGQEGGGGGPPAAT